MTDPVHEAYENANHTNYRKFEVTKTWTVNAATEEDAIDWCSDNFNESDTEIVES